MPPTAYHGVQKRGLNAGNIFSIVFCLVALFVLVTCFTWACLWPHLRKKRDKSRDEQNLTNRKMLAEKKCTFPSHPALLRNFERQSAVRLRTYDPRCETPFSNRPCSSEPVSLPLFTPRRRSQTNTVQDHTAVEPITPVQNRTFSTNSWPREESCTVPRTRAKFARINTSVTDKDFGDAKEYILAIPEPLSLSARSAGKVYIPLQPLQKLATSDSTSSDKHLHPNRLFEDLNRRSLVVSQCSSPSIEIEKKGATDDPHAASIPRENLDNTTTSFDDNVLSIESSDVYSIADMSVPESNSGTLSECHNSSLAAIHRLKTLRSLTGSQDPRPLTRAGTLTRPKTPVADIRIIFDRRASEGDNRAALLPRPDTFITEPFTVGNSSEQASSSTDATSIDFTTSSVSLIPMPLSRNGISTSRITPPRATDGQDTQLPGLVPVSSKGLTVNHHGFCTKQDSRKARLSRKDYTRSRPAPLRLTNSVRASHNQIPELRSISSMGSTSALLLRHSRPRNLPRSSSVYSRDTRGMSFAHSPNLPVFQGGLGQTAISPKFPETTASDPVNKSELTPDRHTSCSPADLIKNKIDNWHYHTDGLDITTPHYPLLRRGLSKVAPVCRASRTPTNMGDDPSVISTDLNTIEAACSHMSFPRICVAETASDNFCEADNSAEQPPISTGQIVRQLTSDSVFVTAERGHAPGGAQWV